MRREQRSVGAMVTAVVTAVTFTACSSSTMIVSRPSGARLWLDGEPVGVTPYVMSDTRIVGSTTVVRMELPGYEPFQAQIQRNEEFSVGACIGGVFLLFPFLWIMGYRGTHTYELRPLGGFQGPGYPPPPSGYPPQGGSWGEQPPGSSPWGPPVQQPQQPQQPMQPPPPPPPPPRR